MSARRNHKIINGIELKWCPNCQEYKKLNEFPCDKATPDGLRGQCRQCKAKADRKYRNQNQGKILQRKREYYNQNRTYCLKKSRQWQIDNPERRKEITKRWAQENPGESREARKNWIMQNPEKNRECKRKYHQRNKEKVNQRARKRYHENAEYYRSQNRKWQREHPEMRQQIVRKHYVKARKKTAFRINNIIKSAIRRSLKGNKNDNHWEDIVGYTLGDLMRHLKKTMPSGYTWDDYMTGKLHIDHKIPVSVFNFKMPEDLDFKKCWALKNLQLLPVIDNLQKSNKLNKPFQPSLAMGG